MILFWIEILWGWLKSKISKLLRNLWDVSKKVFYKTFKKYFKGTYNGTTTIFWKKKSNFYSNVHLFFFYLSPRSRHQKCISKFKVHVNDFISFYNTLSVSQSFYSFCLNQSYFFNIIQVKWWKKDKVKIFLKNKNFDRRTCFLIS